ncbi:MAG: type IV secretory system conjugative DNA transfer family protein [Desulfomicrobium sp.]|uniref:type IV secretory system conjugative DNA transfer family protein n=1 Tax=Hoeflea sp. TaxID=1940281 RepID=UPI0025C548D2|nr:type IV secretory system conjugative DNA transfer family protein [Hoeflea sp.]MBV1711591.1 type IV secretory system conjugative DNA transfer family protein [Desulfomicrobium sp.]MBV1782315.1 type IV secretory system conjugative DNA transfer family protein [Hoeflea sp.]
MAKNDLAGFATTKELKGYTKEEGAFALGRFHPDHGVKGDAAIKDDRHLFIVAGSRAGKGTTMIIPNLIDWPGGVVCIDPKGENASITAMRRGKKTDQANTGSQVKRFLGQDVAILDPFHTVRGPARKFRVAYDPMSDIAKGKPQESDQILTIAEAIVVSEGDKNQHFSDGAETLLAGLIEAVLHTKDQKPKTLSRCREQFQEGNAAMKAFLKSAPVTPAGLAKDALAILEDAGEEEGGAFLTTLSRQLRWMADPRMQRHLRDGGYSLAEAVRGKSSVYICVPPSRIPRMSRWLRLIVRIALDAKMDSSLEHEGPQTLFLLDEFYALGHLKLIEDAAAYMAGYGIKLLPVIQNIGQVKKLYDKNWETFLGNAGGIIAFGLNDLETEKYISDRMGPVMAWETSYSESRSRHPDDISASNVSKSESLAMRERAIRWPSEVHTQGARQQMRAFIIPADGPPFMVERTDYMVRAGEGVFESEELIRAWEANLPADVRNKLNEL